MARFAQTMERWGRGGASNGIPHFAIDGTDDREETPALFRPAARRGTSGLGLGVVSVSTVRIKGRTVRRLAG